MAVPVGTGEGLVGNVDFLRGRRAGSRRSWHWSSAGRRLRGVLRRRRHDGGRRREERERERTTTKTKMEFDLGRQ